jgi:O-antigen/teichoic acid export membrane protein
MGLLSIAKTVPNCIDLLISTTSNIFTPHFTILYATGDKQRLVQQNEFSSKVMSLLMTAPLAGFIAFGEKFYTLWQPTKTAEEVKIIQILSILACVSYLFTCHSKTISSLFVVYNKLKNSVLVSLANGIINITLVLIIVNYITHNPSIDNKYGIFFIAGISSILISLKAFIFVPLYAAHIQKVKWSTYYPSILRGWLCFAVLLVIFMAVNHFTAASNWITFFTLCIICGIIGYVISLPLIFSKNEMSALIDKVKAKLQK